MIWLPSIDQVIEMHSILIRRTGGSDGIQDMGLIESPCQSVCRVWRI